MEKCCRQSQGRGKTNKWWLQSLIPGALEIGGGEKKDQQSDRKVVKWSEQITQEEKKTKGF